MRKLTFIFIFAFLFVLFATPSYAATGNNEVSQYVSAALKNITTVSGLIATLFIIFGGYRYITSSGNPQTLENAKSIIKKAVLGLLLVLGAALLNTLLTNSFSGSVSSSTQNQVSLPQVNSPTQSAGLSQVLTEAITAFLRNIIESATKPLIDSILSFLVSTPSVLSNSVIFNFWLIIIGITDSLFVLVIALLGFHIMSADIFGFEDIELRQILPRLGLSFLLANISILLVEWLVGFSNMLVHAVISVTGGITHAWVFNIFNGSLLNLAAAPLITLIFIMVFIILCAVLLLMYISRLIIIAVGAALAPIIFLLWSIPKFSGFAEVSVKSYIVSVFTVFVHIVTIQLASSFLSVTDQIGNNALIAILAAIGLFFTLLKTPSSMMQLVLFTSRSNSFKKMGTQIVNVFTASSTKSNYLKGAVKEVRV